MVMVPNVTIRFGEYGSVCLSGLNWAYIVQCIVVCKFTCQVLLTWSWEMAGGTLSLWSELDTLKREAHVHVVYHYRQKHDR